MAKQVYESPADTERMMEEICEQENCREALRRVKANKGSPGVDAMSVDDLPGYLVQHWPGIRTQLLSGTYRPQPVRRVEIPKPDGGMRKLGVPTVLDRLIQQAALQVLQRRWDASFSDHSYGFRPGRSAHQAVARAQQYIVEGYGWVVDLDLEKFFGASGQAWRFQRAQFPHRQGERAAPPGIEPWTHGWSATMRSARDWESSTSIAYNIAGHTL